MPYLKKLLPLFLSTALLLSSCGSPAPDETAQTSFSANYRTELCRTIDNLDKNLIHTLVLSETCCYFSVEADGQTQLLRYGIRDTGLDQTFLCLEKAENLLGFQVNAADEVAVAIWHSSPEHNAEATNSFPQGLELRKYDTAGTILWTLALSDVDSPLSFHGIVLGDNGSLAICLQDELRIYQENGELQTSFSLTRENASQLIMLDPQLIFVLYSGEKELYLEQYDGTGEKPSSGQMLPGYRYLFGQGSRLYYVDNRNLGRYDWDQQSADALLDLTIAGVDISCLSAITETEKDIFAAAQWNTGGTALELLRLVPQTQDTGSVPLSETENGSADEETAASSSADSTDIPPEETAQELIFAILNPDSFQSSVVNFNRANTAYNIRFRSYDLDQLDMLNAALAADNTIDLVEITGRYAYNAYAANDYLSDLTPFLQSSGRLSLDDFIAPVRREFLQDGKIYAIPRKVSVGTLACPASILDGKESWTVDEFLHLMNRYPNAFSGDGKSVVETREKLLRMILYRGLNEFVDMAEGRSMLAEPHFQNVLETINALPITTSDLSPEERAAGGEMVIWEILDLRDTRTLQQLEWRSGEELTLIGYPVYDNADNETSAGLIAFGDYVGIHSTSQHQEGAWLYLEQYLSGAFTVSSSGFTTGAEAFEEKLAEDMGEDYVEFILEGIPYPAITQEQSDKVRMAFETAFYYTEEQQAIVSLILEEADSYFCGDKSLEDTVQIIDNRVQLYLDETR